MSAIKFVKRTDQREIERDRKRERKREREREREERREGERGGREGEREREREREINYPFGLNGKIYMIGLSKYILSLFLIIEKRKMINLDVPLRIFRYILAFHRRF